MPGQELTTIPENDLPMESSKEFQIEQHFSQLQILTQTTPADAIKTRKGKGGRTFRYLPAAYVVQTLNFAFGLRWSFEIRDPHMYTLPAVHKTTAEIYEKPFEIEIVGRLTAYIRGIEIVKEQIGKKVIEFMNNNPDEPLSLADSKKAAASDALKKCASLLGVGIDLLEGGDAKFASQAPESPDNSTYSPLGECENVVEAGKQIGIPEKTIRRLIEHSFGLKIGLWDELDNQTGTSTMKLLGAIFSVVTNRIDDVDLEAFIEFSITTGYPLTSGREVKQAAASYEKTLRR